MADALAAAFWFVGARALGAVSGDDLDGALDNGRRQARCRLEPGIAID